MGSTCKETTVQDAFLRFTVKVWQLAAFGDRLCTLH